MRRWNQFSILGLILVGSMTFSGCATKKYVRYQMGLLEPKIAAVSTAVGETNERLDGVDRKAQQGIAAAEAADQKAVAAGRAAGLADGKAVAAARTADTATQGVQQANSKMVTIESRIDSLDNYTAGEAQAIVFKVGSDALNAAARQALDSIANSVAGQQAGFLIEIRGFTDTTGSDRHNLGLSQRRADNAVRYLVSKGVPLYRTSIVGLGEASPVADNASRQGREQNRRVEVRILRSAAVRASN